MWQLVFCLLNWCSQKSTCSICPWNFILCLPKPSIHGVICICCLKKDHALDLYNSLSQEHLVCTKIPDLGKWRSRNLFPQAFSSGGRITTHSPPSNIVRRSDIKHLLHRSALWVCPSAFLQWDEARWLRLYHTRLRRSGPPHAWGLNWFMMVPARRNTKHAWWHEYRLKFMLTSKPLLNHKFFTTHLLNTPVPTGQEVWVKRTSQSLFHACHLWLCFEGIQAG